MSDATAAGRSTLADELAARIEQRIGAGELAAGSWLRQQSLAAEYGVSRTPVREALRKLQAGGRVELRAHRGARVRGPTPREIREAYAVRAELEGLAAELAASWIREEQLARLREAVGRFGRVGPDGSADWARANDLFHEAVLEAAGNERLRLSVADLHRAFPRPLTWAALGGDARLLAENAAEHRAILDALERRDGSGARRAMKGHVRRAGELIARALERTSATG